MIGRGEWLGVRDVNPALGLSHLESGGRRGQPGGPTGP